MCDCRAERSFGEVLCPTQWKRNPVGVRDIDMAELHNTASWDLFRNEVSKREREQRSHMLSSLHLPPSSLMTLPNYLGLSFTIYKLEMILFFSELLRTRVNLAYRRLSINNYSHFSLFMVVALQKVATNTELEIAGDR